MRTTVILKKTYRRKKGSRTFKKYRSEAAAEYKRAFDKLFGSQGAASPVRKIDPATGKVVAIIEP